MTHEQKPRKLKNLVIDRIDLCDKGVNPDAKVVFFKRDAGENQESKRIAAEKFEDMKRRINNLFRDRKDKNMNANEIAKQVEEGRIQTREEVWSAIGKLIDAAVAQELIEASEEQKIARTREQLLSDLISNSEEGRRLWAAWQSLPEGQVAKVQKQEPIQQPASWARIEKMAQSLVSEGKAKTIQEAVTQVATANPDLYREYKREQQ